MNVGLYVYENEKIVGMDVEVGYKKGNDRVDVV